MTLTAMQSGIITMANHVRVHDLSAGHITLEAADPDSPQHRVPEFSPVTVSVRLHGWPLALVDWVTSFGGAPHAIVAERRGQGEGYDVSVRATAEVAGLAWQIWWHTWMDMPRDLAPHGLGQELLTEVVPLRVRESRALTDNEWAGFIAWARKLPRNEA